jgi:ribose transport system permease protein
MTIDRFSKAGSRAMSDYGMLSILLLLCGYFSIVTWSEQQPAGASAGEQLALDIVTRYGPTARVLILARDVPEDLAFADTLQERLQQAGCTVIDSVKGQPQDARRMISAVLEAGDWFEVIAANQVTARWSIIEGLAARFPELAGMPIVQPRSYRWANFLKASNLLNIANQIAVIAILAIGMTLVIITGGIDLSVGSLIALSAVVSTRLIRDFSGAERAGAFGMSASCMGGIILCGVFGAFSALMIAQFAIPPFIVTLAMMLVASGMAYILAQGQSIYQVPDSFIWLGRGADCFGIPNAVILMAILYFVAHVLMTRMPLGRYIYAVGGNIEAARLSGVRVARVLVVAYTACGALAGLGGVVLASQLKSGSPTYGQMYELYTIAAVVVGGTSLSGGEGKILGTLIGAFIIAVIQNGMNLTNVEAYTQKVVLGLVILGAVLLDQLKKRGWRTAPR